MHHLAPDTKIFTIHGGAGNARPIRDHLLRRGWVQNDARDSVVFDLKWADYNGRVDWDAVAEGSAVNHFRGNAALTTKAGLAESLDALHWEGPVDKRTFFPDCIVIHDSDGVAEFEATFRIVAVQAVARLAIRKAEWYAAYEAEAETRDDESGAGARGGADVGGSSNGARGAGESLSGSTGGDDAHKSANKSAHDGGAVVQRGVAPGPNAGHVAMRDPRFDYVTSDLAALAARILERHADSIDGGVQEESAAEAARRRQWEQLPDHVKEMEEFKLAQEAKHDRPDSKTARKRSGRTKAPRHPGKSASRAPRPPPLQQSCMQDRWATASEWASIVHHPVLFPRRSGDGEVAVAGRRTTTSRQGKRPQTARGKHGTRGAGAREDGDTRAASTSGADGDTSECPPPAMESRPPRAEAVASCRAILERLSRGDPQWDLRGDRGAWIIKPIGKSRGRGIEVFTSLADITAYVGGTQERYVAQKYLENPHVVESRKSDCRVWVVVTSWNPLIAYKHEDYYVRWCNSGFSLDSLSDRTIHLANQAVQKHDEAYGAHLAFEDNLWTRAAYQEWLDTHHGAGTARAVEDRMDEIILHTLTAARNSMLDHPASFELFGYDLILDENLGVWLIEVNETPSLDTRPAVLKELVPRAIGSMLDFCVLQPHLRSEPQRDRSITGGWRIISDPDERRVSTRHRHGVDLVCVGTRASVHKESAAK